MTSHPRGHSSGSESRCNKVIGRWWNGGSCGSDLGMGWVSWWNGWRRALKKSLFPPHQAILILWIYLGLRFSVTYSILSPQGIRWSLLHHSRSSVLPYFVVQQPRSSHVWKKMVEDRDKDAGSRGNVGKEKDGRVVPHVPLRYCCPCSELKCERVNLNPVFSSASESPPGV